MTTAGSTALIEPVLADMYVSANQGVFSLRAALTILVIVLITVAVAVQLFRIGRTIVSGWTLSLRSNSAADTVQSQGAQTIATASAPAMIYNERMQSMVSAIERTASVTAPGSVANQRAILLPHRVETEGSAHRATEMKADRRITRGRVTAVRAPIKAVRNAA